MEPIDTPPAHIIVPAKKENFWKDFFYFAFITLLVALPFRFFVAQPFIVSGASMDPTFMDKQYLVVDELTYDFQEAQRGDVVIFRYPLDTSKYFIKRVIGLPGEHVVVEGTRVSIFNKEHPEGLVLSEPYVKNPDNIKTANITLGSDQYFVMGDNRANSADSRYWGPVPKKDMIGRAILRLYPPQNINVFPGKVELPK